MVDLSEPATLRMLLALGLAALAIVLGFVALLKQRTYLDAKTQKPLRIEIPVLGATLAMRTNYPALVFAVLGFILAIYAMRIELPKDAEELEWVVDGTFTDSRINDWDRAGTLELFPPPRILNTGKPVNENGHFNVTVKVPKGRTFEQEVHKITYRHREGEAVIDTNLEYAAYEKREQSTKVASATPRTRTYKSLPLVRFQENAR